MNTAVWEAVQEIKDMEDVNEAKLTKRLVNYMYKPASDPEILSNPWDEICVKLVKGMFQLFSSCKDSEWFYSIDLVPALSAGAMVLLPCAGWQVPPSQIMEMMTREYQLGIDRITVDKALWEMVQSLFGDDEKCRTKMWNAISRSYEPAVNAALADPSPMQEIDRVETFMRRWIDDCISRAWGGFGDQAEEVLTLEAIVDMYDHLLRPFGEDHPFSCVPSVLCEEFGAPPPGWDFIPQAVQDLFDGWNNPTAGPAKKRRKKAATIDEDEEQADLDDVDAVEEEEDEEPPPKPVRKAPVAKRAARKKANCGHPTCTSADDCAGSPEESLIQHILEEGPGDIYCKVCWDSFTERNPDLEGVPVEE
jgi:hypothetical protein